LRRPTLDDVFLSLTGHATDDANVAASSPGGQSAPEASR